MSETKQVQGVLEGEMLRGEWSEFQINVGRQYPVKLSTKQEEVKQLARAAHGQMAVWTYEESEGGPNPHRPGTNFKNRYLSQVVIGGQLTIPQAPPPQTSAPQGSPSSSQRGGVDERRSIERQTIVKAALPQLGLFPDQEQWWAFVYKLDGYVVNGPPQAPVAPVAPPAAPAPQPAPEYDDIPF